MYTQGNVKNIGIIQDQFISRTNPS